MYAAVFKQARNNQIQCVLRKNSVSDILSITILGIMLRTVFLTGIKTVFIITTAMNGAILQTNSQIDTSYTGLVNYYGTWYYVEEGFLNWDYCSLTNYYGTYYGVVNGVLDWNFSGVLRYGTTLYYVRNGVLDWNYKGKAMYCTGKTYTFRNGAAIDYDGYVADAAQALALIKYYEAKEGNTVTLVEAEGMPDDVYNGVAVTVKIRSNDGSEEYYTAITCKNFQQYTNLIGIMENEGDGYLYVIVVAGNHNEENSVVLSNDAILAYLDGMDSFALLNPISV